MLWSAGGVKEPTRLSERVGHGVPVLWSRLVSKNYIGGICKNFFVNCVMQSGQSPPQRWSTRTTSNKHDCEFNDILRLNGYPENAIGESKRPLNRQQDPQSQNTEWLYLKIPFISDRLNRKITGSLEKKTSQYVSLTNPTLWDKPFNSTPQSGHATKQTAPPQAPICAYREIQFTNSRARIAENSTLEAQHDSYTIRWKNILTNDNSSMKKHLIPCHHNNQNIEAKIITRENDPANLQLYGAFNIRKYKRGLNSREECIGLRDLLF